MTTRRIIDCELWPDRVADLCFRTGERHRSTQSGSRQRTRQPTTVASIGLLVSTLCQAPLLHRHKKWNDIGADLILAKNFKRLARRRHTLVSESVDSFLPSHHAVSILRSLRVWCAHMTLRWHRDVVI